VEAATVVDLLSIVEESGFLEAWKQTTRRPVEATEVKTTHVGSRRDGCEQMKEEEAAPWSYCMLDRGWGDAKGPCRSRLLRMRRHLRAASSAAGAVPKSLVRERPIAICERNFFCTDSGRDAGNASTGWE
jgi:hypothetical protein